MPEGGRPTEARIRRMVEVFYARVREDEVLGPIFARRVGSDWDAHLDRMTDFWSTVLLATGRYRGNPLATHRRIEEIHTEHFDTWLALFRPVLEEVFDAETARSIFGRAERMRRVLDGAGARDRHAAPSGA